MRAVYKSVLIFLQWKLLVNFSGGAIILHGVQCWATMDISCELFT